MTGFPYDLTGPIGSAATLGLIVLQVDETIEQDFRRLLPGREVALYVTRIPSGADLTPDTIAQMERDLPGAAGLLPPAARFDAVGYACTSGTTLIGADRVEALVHRSCTTTHVCNPLSAAQAALCHVGVRRIGLVSPYSASIAADLQRAFEAAGFAVPRAISFGEEVEANVARIDPRSIDAAARAVAAEGEIDAVFLSCTNLRTLDIVEGLEQELGLPVISSNLALAWRMAVVAGAGGALSGGFRLLQEGGQAA
ncbi:maleate cis-trans isomerase family protein [Thalassovita aquimarina]|uniref:Aspartate/glutamate racemase family protein n=1 Tax=Thalassovita aquimarina TaxID=2785917 RepID=A0ABS5HRH9_9RHOB|nr:aspartate/glutamate racemase family protein [Thalassovita aquimarina]MBR9651589.1 aspartate/glutamate racemase family protein [Thalassovita aquimarina]